MKIYIAGAMTGIKDYNYPAFFDAEDQLREEGYVNIVNPARIHEGEAKTWGEYLREDIKHLMDCEAIAMIDGWRNSRGATLEYEIAIALSMDIRCFHGGRLLRGGH